jgi:hypothetical protein
MTTTLKLVVICETLGVVKSFQGIWFGHAFFKACQYIIFPKKNVQRLEICSIKFAQENL